MTPFRLVPLPSPPLPGPWRALLWTRASRPEDQLCPFPVTPSRRDAAGAGQARGFPFGSSASRVPAGPGGASGADRAQPTALGGQRRRRPSPPGGGLRPPGEPARGGAQPPSVSAERLPGVGDAARGRLPAYLLGWWFPALRPAPASRLQKTLTALPPRPSHWRRLARLNKA